MRHKFETVADEVDFGLGDRSFINKKGDTIEVSSAWAERIMQTPELAAAYELVEDVPETDEETARVEEKDAAVKA
jgi:hypothetical protein